MRSGRAATYGSTTGRPLSAEGLDGILEAESACAVGRNRQPWDFVVVTDREQLVELAQGLARRAARRRLSSDGRRDLPTGRAACDQLSTPARRSA